MRGAGEPPLASILARVNDLTIPQLNDLTLRHSALSSHRAVGSYEPEADI